MVRHATLRCRARPDDRGEEPGFGVPARRGRRQGKTHGCAGPRRAWRHIRRQPGVLRGRARHHRGFRKGGATRKSRDTGQDGHVAAQGDKGERQRHADGRHPRAWRHGRVRTRHRARRRQAGCGGSESIGGQVPGARPSHPDMRRVARHGAAALPAVGADAHRRGRPRYPRSGNHRQLSHSFEHKGLDHGCAQQYGRTRHRNDDSSLHTSRQAPGERPPDHRLRQRRVSLRSSGQTLFRGPWGAVVHGARLRERGTRRGCRFADAQAFVCACVRRQVTRSGDRACRKVEGARAVRGVENIVLLLGLGSQRHAGEAHLVRQ